MKNSSHEKIVSWGLLRQIKAEEIIDENISSVRLPNQGEFNNTIKQWCNSNKINSEEALRTLRLAREMGGWKLVKLEVLGDKKNLFQEMIETLKSTEILTKEGFKVLNIKCRRLLNRV